MSRHCALNSRESFLLFRPSTLNVKSSRIILPLFAIFFGLLPVSLQAQAPTFDEQWRWSQFTTLEGLPSNRVLEILESSAGTIWAVTQNGLAWFNGYYWNPMGVGKGLPEIRSTQVVPSSNNRLLVLMGGNLYFGDEHGFKNITPRIDNRPMEVSSIAMLPNQRHLLVSKGSIYLLEGDAVVPYKVRAEWARQKIMRVFMTDCGTVWINTAKGLYRNAGEGWTLELSSPRLPLVVLQVACNAVGRWIASVDRPLEMQGLWESDVKGRPRLHQEGYWKFPQAIAVSSQSDAVAVLLSAQAFWRSGEIWRAIERPSQELQNILSVKFKTNGDFWVGTENGLYLHRTSSKRWTRWVNRKSDERNTINEILQAHDGSIWIATGLGVENHRIDGSVRTVEQIDGKRLGAVTALAEDSAGHIWIASGSEFEGAYRFDGKLWSHVGQREGLGARLVHKIVNDRKGRLWFLGLNAYGSLKDYDILGPGVFIYDGISIRSWEHNHELPSGRIYGFAEGLHGEYWFATAGGLSRWTKDGWKHWLPYAPLLECRVFSVAVDHQNQLWFGDQNNGLGKVRNDSVRYFSTADGLVSNAVWSLKVDSAGTLWIATRGGLNSYVDGSWQTFGPQSFLENTRFWPVMPTSSNVYAGTAGGGTYILNKDDAGLHNPRVVMAPPVVHENSALLRWSTFSYLGEIHSNDVEVRYRLDEGPFSKWTKAREITLTNFSKGIHTFQVQAKDMFGTFDTEGQQCSFEVFYAIQFDPMFLVSVGALLLGLIALAIFYAARRRSFVVTLRDSEEKYRRLVHASPDAIGIFVDGKLTYANPACAQLFHAHSVDELLGKRISDIVHPDNPATVIQRMIAPPAESGPAPVEKLIRLDGSIVDVEIRRIPTFYEEHAAVQVMIRDISERILMEETRKKREVQILRAQRAESIALLTGGLAHDLQNILAPVKMSARFLVRKVKDKSSLAVVKALEERAKSGLLLVNAILTYGRGAKIRRHKLDVKKIIRDVVSAISSGSKNRIQIECKLDGQRWPILGDAAQLKQVFLNLCLNAKEAMPRGGTLSIIATDVVRDATILESNGTSSAGPYVVVRITDSGKGISKEDQERIFEPFFTTKEATGGTGLGLSIARNIVAGHNGSITAESAIGKGTTMNVYLPANHRRIKRPHEAES
jgi:PAS domain S-box-containing protein